LSITARVRTKLLQEFGGIVRSEAEQTDFGRKPLPLVGMLRQQIHRPEERRRSRLMPGNNDSRDLIAQPLGSNALRGFGVGRRENVEEIARPIAGPRGAVGDDAVDQPPPAAAKAGAC
jgi:hypothetical protein